MEMQIFEKWFINSKPYNYFNKIFMSLVLDKLRVKKVMKTILELGCGIGESTNIISKKYKFKRLIAIDYDNEQIKKAKSKNKDDKVIFLQGDALKLNFENNYFDFIIESDTLHHINHYQKAFKEAKRVLKDDGYLVIIEFSKYIFNIWPIGKLFPPESFFSRKDLVLELADNGFNIEKSSGFFKFYIMVKKTNRG